MKYKNRNLEYVTKFIKGIPKSTWKRYENSVKSGLSIMTNAGDKEVMSYILENNLTTPNNIAKFMVKMHIEQINAMYDGFYSIKQDYKNEWKSKLESARDKFEYALDNPHKKEKELDFVRGQVMECIKVFKNDIITHISVIREIDQLSKPEYILKSWFSLAKCKKELPFAIETAKRLMEAYRLLFIICSHTNDNTSSLVKNYYSDKEEIINDDVCLLMAAYCEKKDDKDFWYNLSDLWDEQKKFFDETIEVFKNSKKNETGFWDEDVENV
jgi:hypothetical protein